MTRGATRAPGRAAVAAFTAGCLLAALPGCGILGWAISSKEDHFVTEPRAHRLAIDSTPSDASIFVDGNQVGQTPYTFTAPYAAVHRERRQPRALAVLGLVVDGLVALSAFTISENAQGEEGVAQTGAFFGAAFALGLYLVAAHSVDDARVEVQPQPIKIELEKPGYRDVTRRVRVPDVSRVEVDLAPVAASTAAAAPPAAPRPARVGTPPRGTRADQARWHHERARRAYDLGRFDEALAEWGAAYELDPRAQFLYNMGNALRKRGGISGEVADLKQAIHLFGRYRAAIGDGAEQAREIDEVIEGLHEEVRRREQGSP